MAIASGDELHGQPIRVRALPLPLSVELIERFWCQPSGHDAENHPGDYVGHVELARIAGVRQDHVAAKHRYRQPTQVVGLPQQDLARPFAVPIPVRVTAVVDPGRTDHPDVGIFDKRGRHDLITHVSPDFSSELRAVELGGELACGWETLQSRRVVGWSRVAGWGGLSQGRWVFRGRRSDGSGGQPKAVRMCCQAVAIRAAQRQVASMRSRSWRAPRVMRAATCRTR